MKLSVYILTHNSEKYLAQVLAPLKDVADEIVIVDSGSVDKTQTIAERFGAQFVTRALDNFKHQRNYALSLCQHDWVLSLDSDEVPQADFIAQLHQLKQTGFRPQGSTIDAYRIARRWLVLGREVHNFYPSSCPDYPIRLFDKTKVGFFDASNMVHETPDGFRDCAVMAGWVDHYGCDDVQTLMTKLNRYTSIAAQDLKARSKTYSKTKIIFSPIAAWLKWYFPKKGYRDGMVGFLLATYAAQYTFFKYLKYHFGSKQN